jgi:hypothetical protein
MFGTCLECGDEVCFKRLQAVPWTEFCVNCQEKHEQGKLTGSWHELSDVGRESTGSHEILISAVLTTISIAFAVLPFFIGDNHTPDGLFLTLAGSVMGVIFFLNLAREIRLKSRATAKDGATLRARALTKLRTEAAPIIADVIARLRPRSPLLPGRRFGPRC